MGEGGLGVNVENLGGLDRTAKIRKDPGIKNGK